MRSRFVFFTAFWAIFIFFCSIAEASVPTAPSNLIASAVSSSQINLSWTDNSTNEDGFKIERAAASTGPWTLIATTGTNVTSYSNTGLSASTLYYYRVYAYNTEGNSGYSNTARDATLSATIPNAPTSLTATAASSSQINLTWVDNSTNEDGFKIERAAASTGPWTLVATLGANVTSYSNTGLSASTTYYYRAYAYNTAGNSGYSNTASATTQAAATVPNAPTSLTATAASSSQINLTWTDNSTNEDGFKVERATSSTGPWTLIATTGANVTSYSNTGLSASTTYYYRVYAYNTAGNSGYSNTASATTQAAATIPNAPSGLTATAASSSQINLSWVDNSTNEDGFKVERATSSTGPWTLIATTGANATSYSNTGLTASTTHYYRVYAYNTAGNSGYSNTGSATTQATIPNAPSSLAATAASSSQINLTWVDNSTNEDGFKVERAASSTGPWTLIATTGANVTSYSNTGLSASTTYYYRAYAYNTAGNSGYSNTASATTQAAATIPNAPTSLTATAVSSSQINLTWVDNSTNEDGFKVERAASSTGPWTLIATTGANATSYSNTGLTASTTYYYRVYAYNTAGNSGYSNTASATTQAAATIPNAPSSLAATAVSSSQINLTWVDNSTNEDGFKIERAAASTGPWTLVATLGANVTSYSNTGLSASTTYYYRAYAYNTAGNSGYSNTASATTQAAATVPNAPTSLTATTASSSQINLTWADNSTNESGFKVERAASSTGPWTLIATMGANVTSYSNTGLSASTTYYYRVRAYNASGDSSYSNTATVTTPSLITLAINSPSSGATINGPDVMVKGTVANAGGYETGVTVNGIVANVYGNQFTANHVPLQEGTNVITATATDKYGHTATSSVTVYAVTTGNYIRLTADTESGIAPLETTLRIDGTFTITSSSISVTGPVQPELLSSSATVYKFRMTTEGIYHFTATVTGPDGAPYQDTIAITVMNQTQLDNLLKSKWNEMKTALMNKDISNALNYYTENTREHYNRVFTDIYNYLPQFVQNMQDIQLVYIKNNVAKYRIRKDEIYGGQAWTITYYIYFVIDSNGIWKIEIF